MHSFWNLGFGKFFSTQISGSFGSIAFKEVIICQLNFGETFSVGYVIFWLIFIGHKCATSKKKFWIVAILATVVWMKILNCFVVLSFPRALSTHCTLGTFPDKIGQLNELRINATKLYKCWDTLESTMNYCNHEYFHRQMKRIVRTMILCWPRATTLWSSSRS